MQKSLFIAALAIFTAGFLWPVEDAVNGSGLHLVLMWLLWGIACGLMRWRQESDGIVSERFRLGPADWGVLLIVAGHLISTALVFRNSGDRRAALNLTFEWIGLLVTWFFVRSASRSPVRRVQLASALMMIAVGLSAFGIWQHLFFYSQQSEWYQTRRAILDQAVLQSGGSSAAEAAQALEDFQREGVPLEGASRALWENRLLSSSEPFATFSLTNTLAGILASVLVLFFGQLLATWLDASGMRRHRQILLVAGTGLVAWCLILTKSRSAWGGALVGCLAVLLLRRHTTGSRRLLKWGATGLLSSGLLFAVAAATGAVDKEVILESPRSLQFRLMYWTGSLQMLKQQPVFGPGPGNFRQAYLQFRADESSEEIRDPHNFLLESWSSGGVIGCCGLVLFCGGVLLSLLRESRISPPLPDLNSTILPMVFSEMSRSARRRTAKMNPSRNWTAGADWTVILGVCGGMAIHLAWEWVNGASFGEDQFWRMLLLSGVPLIAIARSGSVSPGLAAPNFAVPGSAAPGSAAPGSVMPGVWGAACVAMMINLLAAGGFSMPAVMALFFAIGAVSVRPVDVRPVDVRPVNQRERLPEVDPAVAETRGSSSLQRLWSLGGVFACLFAAAGVSQFGFVPVVTASRYLNEGNLAIQQRNLPRSLAEYRKAAEADPLSVTPRQQIAELESYRLREELKTILESATDGRATTRVDEASELIRQRVRERLPEIRASFESLVASDRHNALGFRRQAQGLAAVGQILQDAGILGEAIQLQSQAVKMYPSSVDSWVELATLCRIASADFGGTGPAAAQKAARLAQDAASRAIALDEINRSWGHSDRYLEQTTLTMLTKIRDGASTAP